MLFNTFLVIVLSVSGVLSERTWGVTYSRETICALKGSAVDMRCTYSYPPRSTVQKTFWFIEHWSGEPEDLSQDPEYSHRVEYLGNQNSNCNYRVNQLTESDSKTYKFRFLTNDNKFTGEPGVTLGVTGLQLMMYPDRVEMGQSVRLTCYTACYLTGSPAFIWYRDGSPLSFTTQTLQVTVSRETAGSYTCAVRGYEHLPSPAVAVGYRPKSTSVSVSPSGAVEEGSSVTLTCSSDALPPVWRYAFIKNGDYHTPKQSDHRSSYVIKEVQYSDAGEYYCEARNSYGTEWSPLINLQVQYPPKSTSVSVSPSGDVVEGGSVTLTCSSDANPPVQRYYWFKDDRAVSLETGAPEDSYTIKNITLQHAGGYICQAGNGIGTNRSPPKRLEVQYPPKSTSVSVIPSGYVVEGNSVTLTCSSDANPPVQTYAWFKKNDTGVWKEGSGQSLSFSSSKSWNSGQYFCESKNRHGPQNASALLVTVQGDRSLIAVAAVGSVAAILALVCLGAVWVKYRRIKSSNGTEQRGREGGSFPIHSNVPGTAVRRAVTQGTDTNDPLYSSVVPANVRNREENLYSTLPDPLPQSEEDVHYASITHHPPRAAPRSPAPSVIYSAVRRSDT